VNYREIPYDPDFLPHLLPQLSEARLNRMHQVLALRTRHLTLVTEKAIDAQNISAVIRTCECVGLQELHVIEPDSNMKLSRFIAKGSNQWMDIHHYPAPNNTITYAAQSLKKRGYQLVATTLHKRAVVPEQLPIDVPLAIIMGSEHHGVSDDTLALADHFVKIPLHGFTESYNLSVASALLAYNLSQRIRASDVAWQLQPDDAQHLFYRWVLGSVRNVDLHWKKFKKIS
jgi:tRNA (guanosine-2'-O-)-methyltransferase